MASSIPRAHRKEITDAYVADNLYVALFTSTGWVYSATNDGHDTYPHIKAAGCNEVVGIGYSTGGYALTGEASNYIGATNVAILTASPTSIPAASFTCRYAVIYETNTANQKIRAVIDLGGDIPVTSGTMTITWDGTNGIIKCS